MGGSRQDKATGGGARGPATQGCGIGERFLLPHLTPPIGELGTTHRGGKDTEHPTGNWDAIGGGSGDGAPVSSL